MTGALVIGLTLPWCNWALGSERSVNKNPGGCPALTVAQHLCAQHIPALKGLHGWSEGYGPGLEIVTSHYRIFTTLLNPVFLKRLPAFMESAHTAYNSLLSEPVTPQTQSVVYLLSQRQEWETFTYAFAGDQAKTLCKIRQGAYCHKGACVAYDIGLDRTFAALGHEGWHQFMTRHFAYRLPSWLDEGLATVFEEFVWEEGVCHFQDRYNVYRMEGLQNQLTQNNFLNVHDLLTTSPGEMMTQDNSESVIGFYSQAYALIRFLNEGQRGIFRHGLQRLLHDGLNAQWPLDHASLQTATDRNRPRTLAWNRRVGLQLFQHYIHPDPARIDGLYVAFCRGIANPMHTQVVVDR